MNTDLEIEPASAAVIHRVEELTPVDAIPESLPGVWWVAHTKPRNEKALALDMSSLGVFCYLPLRPKSTRSRRTGRVSHSTVPVFPGYLFFNGTDDERNRVLRTQRIVQTLDVADQGRLIGELRQIQRAITANCDLQWHPRIKVGDWGRVTAGPLIGAEGVVIGKLSRSRLVLNVGMLGQSVSVEVNRDDLERIDGPSYGS